MDKLKVVSIKGDVDHEEVFEVELIEAINKAYSNGVRRSTVLTLLQVYAQVELNEIIEDTFE